LRFVIGLVVIGAALAIAARVVMNGAPQPATDDAERDRELPRMRFERKQPPVVRTVIGPERVLPTPWWVRARAFVVLSALLALLGAVLALVLVLGGVLVVTGLKNAVQ
jgi:heme O synthase-like polyprenyltransferase